MPSRQWRELSPAAASFCSEATVFFFPSDSAGSPWQEQGQGMDLA